MSHLGLIGEFIAFAIVTWIAGVWLTRTADAIDARYKLGSAFGGLLILGIGTSLPEIAITVSAAINHHYDIVIGTLVGGIALQTALLGIFDVKIGREKSLTYAAASLTLVLEATIVVLVAVGSILAIRTPAVIPHTSVSLASLLIFAIWVGGLYIAYRARRGLPWIARPIAGTPGREHHERQAVVNHPSMRSASMFRVFSILAISATAILISGVGLASTGSSLANAYGIGSGLFAATFIALAAALPDFSTGFSSIKLGDYKLAMSDIFGGNSFMPALFIVADLIAGEAVLQYASPSDVWFAALGILLTGIFVIGLITRPQKTYFRMGIDSIIGISVYIVGVALLAATGG